MQLSIKARASSPILAAAAQWELEGPRITGPMTSLKMLGSLFVIIISHASQISRTILDFMRPPNRDILILISSTAFSCQLFSTASTPVMTSSSTIGKLAGKMWHKLPQS
jgi:hypothetical protein